MIIQSEPLPICEVCKEEEHKQCKRCGVAFCRHHASTIDFRYCALCLEDFSVVETIETKTTEYRNENGVVTSRRRQVAKNLKLIGTDWLFAQHAVENLTDEELTDTIEYHRNIASLMLMERETRRTEYFHKLGSYKVRVIDKSVADTTGATKDKKKKAEKKAPDQSAILAAFELLTGKKLTPEELAALMQKGK